jgi:hypothetical protein
VIKDDRSVKNPALGLIDILKKGLFFISKYVSKKNILRSIKTFGFLQKFKLIKCTLLGIFFFSNFASLQQIKIL